MLREQELTNRYLYSLSGIYHVEYLRRTGDPSSEGAAESAAYARRVMEANLEICERNRWPDQVSMSHRVLGDLDADENEHASARQHYDDALKIARGISYRPALIEVLLARGCWAAKQGQAGLAGQIKPAFNDLDEALGYALEGGFRIYEADIRVALAWAHLAANDSAAARAEASRALKMSQDMGYHWGQVDAAEVISKCHSEGSRP